MKVLVTGAAGFIGRHLVRAELAAGTSVIGVDNFSTSHREDLARELPAEGAFRFAECDVAGPAFGTLLNDVAPEAVFHLACPTGVPNLTRLNREMLAASYEGTRQVLDYAARSGARVVFASSAEVYGAPERSPQDEDYSGNVDPVGPRSAYEEGKRVGESLCAAYARRDGVAAAIARIFNTYGPGMAMDETRVVPAFVRAAVEGRAIVVHGDGMQTRCHTFVGDTVRGLQAMMARGEAGRPYNLGSTRPHTVLELAERVRALTGSQSPITLGPRASHDHQDRLPATERARDELGWSPCVDLDTGLRATIDDIRQRLGC